jgi:hypothetical protein
MNPMPGMGRPTRATNSGWARPSTNVKSHHSTFTVMTMGTRMTSPAMNLLRSLTVSVGRGGGSSAFSAGLDSPLGLVFASMAGIVSSSVSGGARRERPPAQEDDRGRGSALKREQSISYLRTL